MKIGLSYSHCIVDLIEDRLSIDDVLVIISNTKFNVSKDDQWESIWFGYTHDPQLSVWSDYIDQEQRIRSMTQRLESEGKLHQPRMFGGRGHSAYNSSNEKIYWLETVVLDEDMEKNPSVKQAWDHYQLVANLAGFKLSH